MEKKACLQILQILKGLEENTVNNSVPIYSTIQTCYSGKLLKDTLPKQTQEELENLNIPVFTKEIKFAMKNKRYIYLYNF